MTENIINAARDFNPGIYLSKIGTADYLEVKWRLVWLRFEHPDADVETECVSHTNDSAAFKATITIHGGGRATGHGSETRGDFKDFYEKAETKALGRALAALGYGTQFSQDFEFSSGSTGDQPKLVDAPVNRNNNRQQASSPPAANNSNVPASDAQINAIQRILNDKKATKQQQDLVIAEAQGSAKELSRTQAGNLIRKLNADGYELPHIDPSTGEVTDYMTAEVPF